LKLKTHRRESQVGTAGGNKGDGNSSMDDVVMKPSDSSSGSEIELQEVSSASSSSPSSSNGWGTSSDDDPQKMFESVMTPSEAAAYSTRASRLSVIANEAMNKLQKQQSSSDVEVDDQLLDSRISKLLDRKLSEQNRRIERMLEKQQQQLDLRFISMANSPAAPASTTQPSSSLESTSDLIKLEAKVDGMLQQQDAVVHQLREEQQSFAEEQRAMAKQLDLILQQMAHQSA
jgi:hypothetical protein